MIEHTNITTTPLVYKGEIIRNRGETLSLTDMWKSAGSDPARQPSNWLASADASRFIDYVSDVLNPGISGNELVQTVRGGKTPGTWANWQIGLAYAKYLSAEFHAWCNGVVRAHMEGRAVATAQHLTKYDAQIIGNIVKNCAGLVIREQLMEALPALLNSAVLAKMAEEHLSVTDGVTSGEVCDLSRVAAKYPRGISAKVSNHMARFCAVRKIDVPITRLGRVRAMVFPTHAAREWLDLEGRGLIKAWVAEKGGQGALKLTRPRHEPEVLSILKKHLNGAH